MAGGPLQGSALAALLCMQPRCCCDRRAADIAQQRISPSGCLLLPGTYPASPLLLQAGRLRYSLRLLARAAGAPRYAQARRALSARTTLVPPGGSGRGWVGCCRRCLPTFISLLPLFPRLALNGNSSQADAVKAFLAASAEGFRYAAAHPAEAADLFVQQARTMEGRHGASIWRGFGGGGRGDCAQCCRKTLRLTYQRACPPQAVLHHPGYGCRPPQSTPTCRSRWMRRCAGRAWRCCQRWGQFGVVRLGVTGAAGRRDVPGERGAAGSGGGR